MAWEKTREIGCGVSHCPDQSMTMVVCNYSPAGNYLNQRVYISGPPCTQSTGCVNTPASTCDTSSNLCFVGGVPSTIAPGTTAQPATIPTVVSTVVTSHSAAPSEQPTTVDPATGESSAPPSTAASQAPTAGPEQSSPAPGASSSATESSTGASQAPTSASEAPTGASAGSSPAASEAPTGASVGSSPAASEQPTAASVQPTGASGGPTSASEAPTGASAGSSPAASEAPTGASAGSSPAASEAPTGASEKPTSASEAPTGASAGSSPAASVQPTPASEQPTGASGGPTSASEAPTAGSSPGTPPPQSESPGPSGEPTGQTVPSITGSPGTTPSGACHDPEVNPNLPQGSCSDLPDLIRVKPDNTTDLTNTIQNWHRCQNVSTRLGANSMLNRVRRAIWNDSMYPTIESKIKEISSALQGYNFNNHTKQQILFNLTIVAWNRSIGDIIDCAEQIIYSKEKSSKICFVNTGTAEATDKEHSPGVALTCKIELGTIVVLDEGNPTLLVNLKSLVPFGKKFGTVGFPSSSTTIVPSSILQKGRQLDTSRSTTTAGVTADLCVVHSSEKQAWTFCGAHLMCSQSISSRTDLGARVTQLGIEQRLLFFSIVLDDLCQSDYRALYQRLCRRVVGQGQIIISSRICLKMRSFISIQLFLVASFVLLLNIDESVAPEGGEPVDGNEQDVWDGERPRGRVYPRKPAGNVNAQQPKQVEPNDDDDVIIRERAPTARNEGPHHAKATEASKNRAAAIAEAKVPKAAPKPANVAELPADSRLLKQTAASAGKAAGRKAAEKH
ncbi:ancylostoma secreted protein [Ditylenchus destructor]|nr:ancylostoma secreted protein [Ditylenchus destructor]